jgi:hypothetical protein
MHLRKLTCHREPHTTREPSAVDPIDVERE